jgi:hypothetical protein
MATIIDQTGSHGSFGTSTRHTGLSQRETLEAIMLILADHLGMESIRRLTSARGAVFYSPDGSAFQSATNTIYEMSLIIKAAGGER